MLKSGGNVGSVILLLIAIVMALTATILLSGRSAASSESPAGEVVEPGLATVQALSIQLRPGTEGIALIDRKNHTICIYQYQYRGGQDGLALLAARSFRYDVQLEDYNTVGLKPGDVKKLIQHTNIPIPNENVR